MNKRLTIKVLVASAVALALYDVCAAATPERGDTLSEVITEAAHRRPVIAFGFGLLAGHLFWSQGQGARRG